MASYLAGVTDNIRPIELFQPSWQFIDAALSKLDVKQELQLDKFSKLYYNVKHMDLTHEENKKFLENFMSEYENNIKKIAQLDLTKSENIEYASSLFRPIYDNYSLMHDYAFTKYMKNELGKINKSDKSYNRISEQALQYRILEYANSSYEERIRLTPFNYIPEVNEEEALLKIFTDAKLGIQDVEKTNNGYVLKYVNGKHSVMPFANMALLLYRDDPRIIEKYRQQAYVFRMGLLLNYGAEEGYKKLSDYVEQLKVYSKDYANQIKNIQKQIENNKSDVEESMYTIASSLSNASGLSLNAKKKIIDNYEELLVMYKIYEKNLETAANLLRTYNNSISVYDKRTTLKSETFDDLFVSSSLMEKAIRFGGTYAASTFKEDIEFDQIYKAHIYAQAFGANRQNQLKNQSKFYYETMTVSGGIEKNSIEGSLSSVKDSANKDLIKSFFKEESSGYKPIVIKTTENINLNNAEIVSNRPDLYKDITLTVRGFSNPLYVYALGHDNNKGFYIMKIYSSRPSVAVYSTDEVPTAQVQHTEQVQKLYYNADNESFMNALQLLNEIRQSQQGNI